MIQNTELKPNSEQFMTRYGFGSIPEKRKKNAIRDNSLVVFCVATFGSTIGMLCTTPGSDFLLNSALTCIAMIVKTFVVRIVYVCCEYSYIKGRYKGKWEMILACFGDLDAISLLACLFGSLVAIYICLYKVNDEEVSAKHLFHAFSGIGFGTLLFYILKLDSQPVVEISADEEEKETFVANGLAWHYFCDDLEYVFQKLDDEINDSEWKDELTSKKLFILLPLNCKADKDPASIPGINEIHVFEIQESEEKIHYIHVYEIGPHKVMLQFPLQLKTLDKMSKYEQSKGIGKADRKHQVRLFYRTLKDILEEFDESTSVEKQWELIPFDFAALQSEQGDSREWSGLTGFLQHIVLPNFTCRQKPMRDGQEHDANDHDAHSCRLPIEADAQSVRSSHFLDIEKAAPCAV